MTKYARLTAAATAALVLSLTRPKDVRQRRPHSALIPADVEFCMTADHVVDAPREPRVIPTGVFDADGHMICRVIVPIKQQMGFNTGGNAWTGDVEEDVVLLQTSNMIRMSDCGIGIESVGLDELEEGYEDDGDEG